jgi:ribosomal protein S18 acetylase RimI-like enzyme
MAVESVRAPALVTVRQARREDMWSLCSLLHDSFAAVDPTPLAPVRALSYKVRLALDIEQRMTPWDWTRHTQLVAEDPAGQLLGFAEVWGEDTSSLNNASAATPQPVLFNLCVDPTARRSGVARLLVARSEEFCQLWGEEQIFLKVRVDNAAASELYAKEGFSVLETREPTSMPSWQERWKGGLTPLVLMRKQLPPSLDAPASTSNREPRPFDVSLGKVLAYRDADALVWFTLLMLRNAQYLTPSYRLLPVVAALVTWFTYYAVFSVFQSVLR